MVLADPVSHQTPHGVRPGGAGATRPGRATCHAAPSWCRADAGRPGSNRVHRFYVLPCVRYDGPAAGVVQPGGRGGGWLGAAGTLEGRNIVRVHVVVPEGFDHPSRPTGGNIYDRRVCAGLAEAGFHVLVTTVAA